MLERLEEPRRLGSYDSYVEENGLEQGPAALDEYFAALSGLRKTLAEERGISLDDLHSMNFSRELIHLA